MSGYSEQEDTHEKDRPIFNAKDTALASSTLGLLRLLRRGGDKIKDSFPELAVTQNHMNVPENDMPRNLTSINEQANRAAEWAIRMCRGGEATAEQEILNQIGAELREARRHQSRSINQIANEIGLDPAMLCFLEVGWVTREEFLDFVNRWANTLGKEAEEYRQQIEPQSTLEGPNLE